LECNVDVVNADIPFLIGLDFSDKHKIVADNVDNILRSKIYGWEMPIRRIHGHLLLTWDIKTILFTGTELEKLHKQFFHPSSGKLYNLLKRAFPNDCPPSIRSRLEQISKDCLTCQQRSNRISRFSVSIPEDGIVFNFEVALDVMYIDISKQRKAPILHVVDTQTHFQNAIFLKSESAKDVWAAFIETWASTYTGYPRKMRTDQGSTFTSMDWGKYTTASGIELIVSGIESHNSLGSGERYHDPLRQIFYAIKDEYPTLDPEIALRCAVKGINDTAGPEGLVPSLLVFGTIPTFPAMDVKPPNQKDRLRAISLARDEMSKITAKLRIRQALRSKLPPATEYLVNPGHNVYVFTEKSKRWHRPFQVQKVYKKNLFLKVGNILKQFNISQILPDFTAAKGRKLNRFHEAISNFKPADMPGIC